MLTAFQIRKLVFSDEQGVPPRLERDAHDEKATHLLANIEERSIGVARVRHLSGTDYKIERVAILLEYRGLGLGRKFFKQILVQLKLQGTDKVLIHAQMTSILFYEKLDLVTEGPVFEEAGIPHRKMVIELKNLDA